MTGYATPRDAPAADERSWLPLARELDAWRDNGDVATFWWRDDDAAAVTPAFERLAALSERYGAPLVVAVVPVQADTCLASFVHASTMLVVAQHGHAHVDLSGADRRGRAELSSDMPDDTIMERLACGKHRLTSLFGDRFEPVVVPPWNRISGSLRARLPGGGYTAVSTFGPRESAEPVAGLRQVNAHCDIVDWKGGKRFRGVDRAVGDLVEHLAMRRSGAAGRFEPTGLLTHHLDHDADSWAFLAALLRNLTAHPAATFLGREAFRQ